MIDAKQRLYCVWTGQALHRNSLDIDHCFPWSAWPCGDLWNLMPSSRRVTQREKRDLLPNKDTLRKAKDRVVEWWDAGYCAKPAELGNRFRLEATARLPSAGSESDLADVFIALALQRLRLSNDQQIPEWRGTTGEHGRSTWHLRGTALPPPRRRACVGSGGAATRPAIHV